MKANTSRANATAFDAYADVYDDGRRRLPRALLMPALDRAGLRHGSRVLEVGAGTGQLTGELLAAGMTTVAIEPGERMGHLLSARYSNLEVLPGTFEEQAVTPNSYDGIVGANSWHWVDPARGYPLAASFLVHNGVLLFCWTFSLARADLQRQLNVEVFSGDYSNQARDPDTVAGYIDDVTAAGRAEITDSGLFDVQWWETVEDSYVLSPDTYVNYLRSFADIAALDTAAQHELADRVLDLLAGTAVPMTDSVYFVCAGKRAVS